MSARRFRTAFRFSSPLYPIADVQPAGGTSAVDLAEAILSAGVPLLQLRAKFAATGALVEIARAVKAVADRHGAALIVNDRADVCRLIDAAGVHLGQLDLDPRSARRILGPEKIIGFSTHNSEQLVAALRWGCLDYVAYGPVFPTRSKQDPDPVQGLEALREAARLASLPLVAIGGITCERIGAVLAAGADAAAVIGAIANAPDPHAATCALLREARKIRDPRPPRRK